MDLPAGAHLSVDQVSPNSPAEQAGLRLYDVLLQLDDQILINSSQLKALVRMKKPGDLITLKLLRKGEPKILEVTLSETDVPIILRRNSRSFGDLDDFFSASRPRDFESLLPGLDADLQDLLKEAVSHIPRTLHSNPQKTHLSIQKIHYMVTKIRISKPFHFHRRRISLSCQMRREIRIFSERWKKAFKVSKS